MQLIHHLGARCIGIELDLKRRQFAETLGLADGYSGSETDFQERLAKVTEGRGVDCVLLTAGNPDLVASALKWLRAGGTCAIFASLHPDSQVCLDWNQLYYRELNVVSSYSASPADLAEALELLATRTVNVTELTKHTFTLEQFSDALAAVESRTILKAIMTPYG